jgi:hypothetical protein
MRIYDMGGLGRVLGLREGMFLTRGDGERAYGPIESRLREVPEGEALVLRFPPGQLIDSSFGDEAIVRLAERLAAGEYGERGLLLEGLTEDSIYNLDSVIHLRGLRLTLMLTEGAGQTRLVGRLERGLREALGLVEERGSLTAAQLADALGLAINNASNRLRRLHDQRVVRRQYEVTNRGLEYTYFPWRTDGGGS